MLAILVTCYYLQMRDNLFLIFLIVDVFLFVYEDFGAGLGFTDILRDLLIHVTAVRGNQTVFETQSFGGFVGVLVSRQLFLQQCLFGFQQS